MFFWVSPRRQIVDTPHPAFEDGTDRGFRNVGKPQSDTGEVSKRTFTRIGLILLRTQPDICLQETQGRAIKLHRVKVSV